MRKSNCETKKKTRNTNPQYLKQYKFIMKDLIHSKICI